MTYRKQADPAVDEEHLYVNTPDGRRVLIGLRRDLPETLDGERRYVRHTTMMPDARGALIGPDDLQLVECQTCGGFPLRKDGTRMCAACLATTCLGCAVPVPDPDHELPPQYLCEPCARRARRTAIRTFFFSVR